MVDCLSTRCARIMVMLISLPPTNNYMLTPPCLVASVGCSFQRSSWTGSDGEALHTMYNQFNSIQFTSRINPPTAGPPAGVVVVVVVVPFAVNPITPIAR